MHNHQLLPSPQMCPEPGALGHSGLKLDNGYSAHGETNGMQHTPIHAKELLTIILAIATWGPYWRSSPIKVLCDNMAVINIITSNTSRDKLVMHLLRGLHFVSVFYNIQVEIQHIAGSDNTIADAIYRDHLQRFSSTMHQQPTQSQLLYPTHPGESATGLAVSHSPRG